MSQEASNTSPDPREVIQGVGAFPTPEIAESMLISEERMVVKALGGGRTQHTGVRSGRTHVERTTIRHGSAHGEVLYPID